MPDGSRDFLRLWIENTEGAAFWMKVFNALKTHWTPNLLIAVPDDLNDTPQALATAFAAATPHTGCAPLIRHSFDDARAKVRTGLAAALIPIATAPKAEATQAAWGALTDGPCGQQCNGERVEA